MRRRNYSRLASVEEKRNIRKAVVFVFLSIVALVFIFFWGIPTLIKFAGFVSSLTQGQKPIERVDITPPAPPEITSLPDSTNQKNIMVKGHSEAGASIIFSLNNRQKELLADKNGNFSFDFSLVKGENSLSAISKDQAGNESQKTKVYKIVFDDTAPTLEITKPEDGTSYYGSGQRQVVIQGTTNPDSQLNINDRLVTVDTDGKFEYATTLNEGGNEFSIKATDSAGNTTEKTISLNFTP